MINIISKNNVISFLTFVCVFFPYVGPKIIPSDNQPFALIFAIIFLLLQVKIKISKDHFLLLIPWVIALIITVIEYENFVLALRSLIGYTAFLVLNIFFYNHSLNHKFPVKLFKLIIIVWVLVALVQLFIDKNFMSFLISNFRTHELRGVVSLASEPSYLGVTGCFFLIICTQFLKSNLFSALSILLVVLSQSGFAIILMLFFLISLLLNNFFRTSLKNRLAISALLFIIFFVVNIISNDLSFLSQRLAYVFTNLTKDPMSFIYLDASSADRVFHVYYSFLGSIDSYLLPNGFSFWDIYAWDKFSSSKFIWITTGRIMSTYGAMFFELGLFAIPIIIFINKKLFKTNYKNKFAVILSLNFYLLFAIPIVYPLIPLILNLKNYNNDRS